jgi:pimeloyl-ACP methyl ester carboxylesterase
MFARLHHVNGNRNAIVYVHGFTGDSIKTWQDISSRLVAEPPLAGWDHCAVGYESSPLFDIAGLWSADARIEEIAAMLYTELCTRQQPYSAIALVAHSMGGLVVQRALVGHEELRRKASHVIFFGTPSGGLVKANLLSFWKRQVRNMSKSGEFIPALRQAWDDQQLSSGTAFKLLVVAGESDQFVPPDSSLGPFPESVRRVIPGNHLTMIRSSAGNVPAVEVLNAFLVGSATSAGPRNAASVALEEKRFQKVLEAYWPTRTELDSRAAVDLAIALDSLGRRDEAMEVLRPHCQTDGDAMGTLAGRMKRRWLVARRRADAEEALRLYGAGYELSESRTPPDHRQAYYHATNLAFMHAAYGGDMETAEKYARATIRHAEAAARPPKAEHWRLASLGDAHLVLGDIERALAYHQEAIQADVDPWQALSSQEQSIRLADLCGVEEGVVSRLSAIYAASHGEPHATL